MQWAKLKEGFGTCVQVQTKCAVPRTQFQERQQSDISQMPNALRLTSKDHDRLPLKVRAEPLDVTILHYL